MHILLLCTCVWFSLGSALLLRKAKEIFFISDCSNKTITVFSQPRYRQISYLTFGWLIQLFTWKWVVHCEREISSFQYKTSRIWVQWQNYPKRDICTILCSSVGEPKRICLNSHWGFVTHLCSALTANTPRALHQTTAPPCNGKTGDARPHPCKTAY